MRPAHKACYSTLLLLLLTFNIGYCFQVSGGGGTVKFVQSGNPGTSTTFTVASTVRIEGRGVVVENNDGAVDWVAVEEARIAAEEAAKRKSGAEINQVMYVCVPETGERLTVIPRGTDDLTKQYEQCVGQGQQPYDCALDWIRGKGYLLENECTEAPTETPEAVEPSIFVVQNEEAEFKPAAPEEPTPPAETVSESTQESTSTVTEPEAPVTADTKLISISRPISAVSISQPKTDFLLSTGLQARALSFPSASPEEFENFKLAADKTYYSCVNVPRFMIQNPWWKWLAMRLFVVLICMVAIIFLLAFWVFLLWRREDKAKGKKTKKKNWWSKFKKKYGLRL